jgi:hypothetical protein
MNKNAKVFLFLIIMLLPACTVLYAQNSPGDIWLNPSIRYQLPGQEFDLEMYINTGNTSIGAFHLEIAYDPLYLETDLEFRFIETSFSTFINETTPGLLSCTVLQDAGENVTGSALPVFSLSWYALEEIGETAISITMSDVTDDSYNPVEATTEIFTPMTITDTLPGDCDGNGVVDIIDALLVARIYVGLIPAPDYQDHLDVNCDGDLTIVDALMIARYYVGVITGFCSTAPEPQIPVLQPSTNPGAVWIEPKEMLTDVGREFTQDIYIDYGTECLGGYQIDIFYDSTILAIDTEAGDSSGVSAGSGGFFAAVNNLAPGKLTINGFDMYCSGDNRKVHLLTLHWRSLDAAGTCPVYLTVTDLVDTNYQVLGEPTGDTAAVKVVSGIRGDVNDDNKITAADALIMMWYYPGGLPHPYESGLIDANCDGDIDVLDALLLTYYTIGITYPDVCDISQLPDAADMPPLYPPGMTRLMPAIHHATPGGVRNWEIYLSNGMQEVGLFEIEISFNPDLLLPFNGNVPAGVSAGPGVILETVDEPEPGRLRISGSAPADSGNGILLCTVDLQAGTTEGEGDIHLEVLQVLDDNGSVIGQPAGAGSRIKIQNPVLGEVYTDGLVNIADARAVAECYVSISCSPFDPRPFDVNSDGSIDIVDALLIAQYVARLISGFE